MGAFYKAQKPSLLSSSKESSMNAFWIEWNTVGPVKNAKVTVKTAKEEESFYEAPELVQDKDGAFWIEWETVGPVKNVRRVRTAIELPEERTFYEVPESQGVKGFWIEI